jgi:uncharacterized membrane protein YidH (DUF202 family)
VSGQEPDGRDPGLAAERTDLAWDRSGLSLLAVGGAILRGIDRPPLSSPNTAIGISVMVLGACAWSLGAWQARRARRRGDRRTTASDLAPVSFGVAAVGVAAFVLAASSG